VAGDSHGNFALVRYWRNGRLDNSFGRRGKVITDLGHAGAQCHSLALQSDGKIVTAGYRGHKYALLRYNGDTALAPGISANDGSLVTKEENLFSIVRCSPNPVADILHIEGLSTSSKTISLLNLKGKLVRQVTTANSTYSFSMKQFAAGIYFVRIDERNKTTTLKFIKE